MTDQYSDSIEKFKQDQGQGPSQGQGPGQGLSQENSEQAMRQQQAMQQQAMQQRAMQQQAMQQQAMQQQAMQQQAMQQQMLQQQGTENFKGNDTFFSKIKNLNMNKTLQEIFLIAILFIIFSTAFFKTNLSKILPFVSVEMIV